MTAPEPMPGVDYRAELLTVLADLERDLDGIADEMDLTQIEWHDKARWALECARIVCNPSREDTPK